MGENDSTISSELGQNTGTDLIRSIYGDRDDLVGGNLFDWLPETMPPAWELLASINTRRQAADVCKLELEARPRKTWKTTHEPFYCGHRFGHRKLWPSIPSLA